MDSIPPPYILSYPIYALNFLCHNDELFLLDVTEELATANETEAVLDTVDEKIANITGVDANDTDVRYTKT